MVRTSICKLMIIKMTSMTIVKKKKKNSNSAAGFTSQSHLYLTKYGYILFLLWGKKIFS